MKEILEKLVNGEINADEAEHLLKADNILEFDNIAKYDIKRNERTGFPEAVFSPSKDYEDLLTIIRNYLEKSDDDLIITKLTNERHDRILEDLGENSYIFDYNRRAQILIIRKELAKRDPIAKIGIITAGTSDINIAEEARVIVEEGGCEAITSYDIGVAGIHRLFPQIAHMVNASGYVRTGGTYAYSEREPAPDHHRRRKARPLQQQLRGHLSDDAPVDYAFGRLACTWRQGQGQRMGRHDGFPRSYPWRIPRAYA